MVVNCLSLPIKHKSRRKSTLEKRKNFVAKNTGQSLHIHCWQKPASCAKVAMATKFMSATEPVNKHLRHGPDANAGASHFTPLALQAILGESPTGHELPDIICRRIREAAKRLELKEEDLEAIFSTFTLLEGETTVTVEGREYRFPFVEAHHLIQNTVGKGALKIVLPQDLVRESRNFAETAPREAEVLPPPDKGRWDSPTEAWEVVRKFMRELIIGETLSMSLKSQATDAPFGGSEGLVLCACGEFDSANGRFFLKPVLSGDEDKRRHDKELLEAMMNATAEILTRSGKIAHDRIVHAAETNSTLTARLDLQLPVNVVEGHLRALLTTEPEIVIGDEDMTVALRQLLNNANYRPTTCAMARMAARMQLNHAVLLPRSREQLRLLLEQLPESGTPAPEQFRKIVNLFFGAGETQQTEDQVFHHREPLLRRLAAALSTQCLLESDDPQLLEFCILTLLDNSRRMMKGAMMRHIPPYEPLPPDWPESCPLLLPEQEAAIKSLLPPATTSQAIRRSFVKLHDILLEALKALPPGLNAPWPNARRELLAQIVKALEDSGGILPSVERLRFFLTPFTIECLTPKLGVVTRKPLSVCGSELRPEAMAAGALAALETFFRSRGAPRNRPLAGLTFAIQGLGNAGKGLAWLANQRGARIVAVSDSRGAILAPDGLNDVELMALIEHKNAGRRLDSIPANSPLANPRFILHRNPDVLKTVKADVLVLTAMAGAITPEDVPAIQNRVICELTGAAVTCPAAELLRQRGIAIIPDNLASSGGLLVSLSEMLQNSAGQQWDRALESETLSQQIELSFDAINKTAKKHGVDIAVASDILALDRMRARAVYRNCLQAAARKLRQEIEAISDQETVMIVSDDDDDGVASAAILRRLMTAFRPGLESRLIYFNESLRSRTILDAVESYQAAGTPIRRIFVLDRSFPLTQSGQQCVAELAQRCQLTIINNHALPAHLLNGAPGKTTRAQKTGPLRSPSELGIWLLTPQTLQATIPPRYFTTALLLRELALTMLPDSPDRQCLDWIAAVGSCLDVPPEVSTAWQLFYAPFNTDDLFEAARALRMVARAYGFMNALQALEGLKHPDMLETHKPWQEFLTLYKVLAERVQLLVEKIIMENAGRPYIAHFFTAAEVATPISPPGTTTRCLDLYPWISEILTTRPGLADKPIIVGQVVRDLLKRPFLGVRIRSPRDVELLENGLPDCFYSGGLPNTALAKIPLAESASPEQQFQALVDSIWWKTISPTVRVKKPTPKI